MVMERLDLKRLVLNTMPLDLLRAALDLELSYTSYAEILRPVHSSRREVIPVVFPKWRHELRRG